MGGERNNILYTAVGEEKQDEHEDKHTGKPCIYPE